MISLFDFWKFLAGLGLFLYGILIIEVSLRFLSGRHFKKLIRRHTENTTKSIFVGIFSTMILQSSSAVTLMLLALVGSGVLSFRNGLGIILGSNLGTTFTGWIVSTFGFKFNIQEVVYPLIAIGALLQVFLSSRKILSEWGKFLTGLGLLFFGLSLMKDSVFSLESLIDFKAMLNYNIYLFALGGFIFTAIIQSSSATMAITLTALNAHFLTLDSAAAVVVGANLGTTITIIIAAIGGTPDKKRVAAAHFLFNLTTCILALVFMTPLLNFALKVVGSNGPLYSLVFFQSSFNLLGIFMFWPFLKHFSSFLLHQFKNEKNELVLDIEINQPEAALESLTESLKRFVIKTLQFNQSVINNKIHPLNELFRLKKEVNYLKRYEHLKVTETTILGYALSLQGEGLTPSQALRLHQIMSSIRNLGHSRKSIKDVSHNLEEFENSSYDSIHELNHYIKNNCDKFYDQINRQITITDPAILFEELVGNLNQNKEWVNDFVKKVYDKMKINKVPKKYVSNLFNVNREIFASNQFLLFSIADIWMAPQYADNFMLLPYNNFNIK